MRRKIIAKVQGVPAVDGAGVHLVRVLGHHTVKTFDPILLLDSFDSINPDDYTAGFPLHPHRGLETVSYVYRGGMVHKDTLGNEDGIGDGEVQWMNSGSGIQHEEQIPPAERMLGVQLWLNLPQKDKMSQPMYHPIHRDEIEKIPFDGGTLHLLAGNYDGHVGYQSPHLPFTYYDIHLDPNASLTLRMEEDESVMLFTLLESATIAGDEIEAKTAVKLSEGTEVTISAGPAGAQVLYVASRRLNEPVSWMGPIVMNSRQELQEAFDDLKNGTFIRDTLDFNA